MKCISCGRELPEGVKFCMFCGASQEIAEQVPSEEPVQEPAPEPVPAPEPEPAPAPAPEPAPETEPAPEPEPLEAVDATPEPEPTPVFEPDPEPQPTQTAPIPTPEPEPVSAATAPAPKPKKIKPWMIVLGILAVLGIGAAVIFNQIAAKRAAAYEEAQGLYAAGDYSGAATAFSELGSYEDSEEMYRKSNLWLDALKAEDAAGTDPAAWTAAAEAYDLIGESKAKTTAEYCRDNSSYYTGIELMEAGSWAEASEVFSALSGKNFHDSSELQLECDTHIEYEEAEKLLADGHYYDAYLAFMALSDRSYDDLPDFYERAQACIQSKPATGVVWRNPSYSGTDCDIEITNSAWADCYYKFYIGDDLVLTVYIPANESASFSFPSGTYRMNKGYGYDWFGTDDMFGDDGTYYTSDFGGSETYAFESGYSYTMSSGSDGTGINDHYSDRGSI